MQKSMKILVVVLLILTSAGAFVIIGVHDGLWSAMSIKRLNDNKSVFLYQIVTVKGEVTAKQDTSTVGIDGWMFRLNDNTSAVWVFTSGEPPLVGDLVVVTGNFSSVYWLLGNYYISAETWYYPWLIRQKMLHLCNGFYILPQELDSNRYGQPADGVVQVLKLFEDSLSGFEAVLNAEAIEGLQWIIIRSRPLIGYAGLKTPQIPDLLEDIDHHAQPSR